MVQGRVCRRLASFASISLFVSTMARICATSSGFSGVTIPKTAASRAARHSAWLILPDAKRRMISADSVLKTSMLIWSIVLRSWSQADALTPITPSVDPQPPHVSHRSPRRRYWLQLRSASQTGQRRILTEPCKRRKTAAPHQLKTRSQLSVRSLCPRPCTLWLKSHEHG